MENAEAPFKFIDLFAGIGGLRRGFDAIGGECVFTCEMNKYSQETYRANFGADHEIAGNVWQTVISGQQIDREADY